MRRSLRKGFSFGLTSGIITTLGLIVGLNSVSDSVIILIEGILIIAISDSMSDALGIHISEESENKYSNKAVWESTLATLLTKFVFAISFIIPLLLLEKSIAVIISVIWGLGLIAIMSYYMAKRKPTITFCNWRTFAYNNYSNNFNKLCRTFYFLVYLKNFISIFSSENPKIELKRPKMV